MAQNPCIRLDAQMYNEQALDYRKRRGNIAVNMEVAAVFTHDPMLY
jgi:hypothetical protein